jgi:hypothetical protein
MKDSESLELIGVEVVHDGTHVVFTLIHQLRSVK